MEETGEKWLVVLNTRSGKNRLNRKQFKEELLEKKKSGAVFFELPCPDAAGALKKAAAAERPALLVAVGGDGTVSLVAAEALALGIPMGIIPAGSANGMARELGIPESAGEALEVILKGRTAVCDAVMVNNHWLCLHLSDMGLNARLIKYFEDGAMRGMYGYAIALIKAVRNRKRLKAMIQTREGPKIVDAVMVIVANASKYGTGAVINPAGSINDGLFEVVIVKKIGLAEVISMFAGGRRFNPRRIEVHHATAVTVETSKPAHFQVDGEYIGKLRSIEAKIAPGMLRIIVP